MRDARQISAREVSQGVQRHVLDETTWFGSTVMAHSGAAPLVSSFAGAPSRRPLRTPRFRQGGPRLTGICPGYDATHGARSASFWCESA
jgi:hypothetical protein